MSCCWLYLASRTTPERFCDRLGHPFCPEHQSEIDAMDKDWDEILTSLQAVCEEPKEERRLCAVCSRRPVHDDCVYCELCCQDDVLGLLGSQGRAQFMSGPALE
jgi:hypothetical protein